MHAAAGTYFSCEQRLLYHHVALQPCAHLHDLEGTLHALLIVVGHPYSLGQALLLALSQALIEVVVSP